MEHSYSFFFLSSLHNHKERAAQMFRSNWDTSKCLHLVISTILSILFQTTLIKGWHVTQLADFDPKHNLQAGHNPPTDIKHVLYCMCVFYTRDYLRKEKKAVHLKWEKITIYVMEKAFTETDQHTFFE